MKRSTLLLLSSVWLLLVASPAWALHVEEVLWNFNDSVVPGRMNLLSVRVSNAGAQNVDATLTLRKQLGGGRVGLAQVEPCFLSPGASRWVQFMVLIAYGQEEFELSWGRGPDDRRIIDNLKTAAPAVVLLQSGADLSAVGTKLRRFPLELFPTHVMGTENLAAVLIDQPIELDEARRTALREWVHRGGVVHVLPGPSGRHAVFSGDLAALQSELSPHRYGDGLVVRHQTLRVDMTTERLAELGYAPPQAEQIAYGQTCAQQVLTAMGQLTQSKHNWGLLFTLGWVYLALVGPAGWWVGRIKRKHAASLLLLAAAVVGFSGAFLVLGRRGYDEQSTVHHLAYARPIGSGWYDLTQYIHLFVTQSDQYVVSSAASHSVFATVFDTEAARGFANSGAHAQAVLDMPLFSRRELLHRGRAQGPVLDVQVTQWSDAPQPRAIELQAGPQFPQNPLDIWLVDGSTMQRLARQPDGRLRAAGDHQVSQELQSNEVFYYSPYVYGHQSSPPRERLQFLSKRLMAEALSLKPESMNMAVATVQDAQAPAPPPAPPVPPLHLFVLAEAPPTMHLIGQGLGKQRGLVLYHVILPRPEPAP